MTIEQQWAHLFEFSRYIRSNQKDFVQPFRVSDQTAALRFQIRIARGKYEKTAKKSLYGDGREQATCGLVKDWLSRANGR